jgi:Zn-dependent M28 family amino/carboxypeptidase
MLEAGILGIIQSSSVPIRALYDRKNLESMTFDRLPGIPDIKLDSEQYKLIASMVERREYFQLEFDIRNHFRMGPVKYHNVIGVIRGSKYPDEYVIAGGHLDAYDVATGGVDCASGVAPVMEAARLIAQAGGKPERTILFCLWAGEEFGLLGSKYFVESGTVPLEKIANYFNRDSTPFAPMSITVPEAMYDDFVKVCRPLDEAGLQFPFTVEKRSGEPGPVPKNANGSDHAYFARNGVPTISLNLRDPKGYNFSYGEIWHTERDTYNKSIPEYQEHAAVTTAVILYGVADLDHLLSREGLYKNE